MPRGIKGSGKKKAALPPVIEETEDKAQMVDCAAETTQKKARKAYPTTEERVALADKQIVRLTALNESRKALIEKTEATLNERKSALAKSEEALQKQIAKKERLLTAKTRAPKPARAAKQQKAAQLAELMAVLESSGKSMADLLAELKGE